MGQDAHKVFDVENDRYLDKRDAARFLGDISLSNLQNRLRELPHYRLGGKILFKKSELIQFMEQHAVRQADLTSIADDAVASVLGPAQ